MTATIDTRLEHLRKAQQVRLARTSIVKSLRAANPDLSRQYCADLLADPPDCLGSMLTIDLVQSIRYFGKGHGGSAALAERLLERCGVGWGMTVGKLTDRQRQALATLLRETR